MPIRILSLPLKDLQYALNCMDVIDIISFSLCSKRTKHLVKSSSRKNEQISAKFDRNEIKLRIYAFRLKGSFDRKFECVLCEDSLIEQYPSYGIIRKQGFTPRDWIAHFSSIFHESKFHSLVIKNVNLSDLDTVNQCITKCQTLRISRDFSIELSEIAFLELCSIAENVDLEKNVFHNQNHISKFLNLNLKSVHLSDWENPFKLELSDLLAANSIYLSISTATITDKELNRFLKIWMKSNHIFYRPEYIEMFLDKEINREEVLRGIKDEAVRSFVACDI
ncbi:unnamed protein product [Caenorhabditis nigoni]